MKRLLFCFFVVCLLSQESFGQELNPKEFANKIKALPGAVILDVRTPGEFSKEHLDKAVNIDWRDSSFVSRLADFDKSKPLMVYCLGGVRSKQAAEKLRELGFKEVYDMKGGILKWNADGLSEAPGTAWVGISRKEYDVLVDKPGLVLVDFYAEWCGPCKLMEPYLNEMKVEKAGVVSIHQVDADKNRSVLADLKIEALPVFHLYKNNQLIWQHSGFISRQDLEAQLEKAR